MPIISPINISPFKPKPKPAVVERTIKEVKQEPVVIEEPEKASRFVTIMTWLKNKLRHAI